ncbi:MAG: T9SS type A sorting domain-containing protein [Chitinophagaceae bacterium]
MKQFYAMLIILSATFTAKAQIPIPAAPASGNVNNCTTTPNIDVCPPGNNTVVGTHRSGAYNRGNNSNHLGVNAIWRYRNMATVGTVTINVEVTIDAISNAVLDNIDDDAAVDQAGVSIASFFAPRISPDQNLNGTNRRGYVQFSMKFYKNSTGTNNGTDADFGTATSLLNLNYVHYDIDGSDAGNVNSGVAGSWFRETGLAQKINATNPLVLSNAVTELVSYDYTDAALNWTGFAGTVYERSGVSRCAQVASAFNYSTAQPGITVRMGYDYNAGNNVGKPIRQYGSRLGCFNFPSLSTLPVDLISFSATYGNQQTSLKWTSENEVNFEKFIIERSATGSDFIPVGDKRAAGKSGRTNYDYTDDLTAVTGSIFYYRLKMVDIDGKFTYSPIVLVKKEAKTINGIAISPNPIVSGATSVRFAASRPTTVDFKVVDISGKTLLQQKSKAYDGNNTITINNLDKLQPGTYILQMVNDGESSVIKFSVTR